MSLLVKPETPSLRWSARVVQLSPSVETEIAYLWAPSVFQWSSTLLSR